MTRRFVEYIVMDRFYSFITQYLWMCTYIEQFGRLRRLLEDKNPQVKSQHI